MNPAVREQLLAAGLANQRRGQLEQAEQCYRVILGQVPQDAEALYRMGLLALQCANASGATHYLEQACSLRRFDADGWYNLGMAHVLDYELDKARTAFERARANDPEHAPAAVSLGNVNKLMGRTHEAGEAYLAAVASPRVDAVLFSQILIALHTIPAMEPGTLFELHREWSWRYARVFDAGERTYPNARDPQKRLTIGLVSPKFNAEIVGHFLRRVVGPLAAHADVYLYDGGTKRDWLTEELSGCGVRWRDIAAMRDDEAANAIASDGIDVLVDLAGHAPGNRLLVFARRPAPVQATWLDYFDTTGVEAIDLLITDPISTPRELVNSGAQRFVESLGYVPDCRLCFTPPPFAPEVSQAPALVRGAVTFGCFGRADKIHGECIALWSRVLHAVGHSTLLLKGGGFDVLPVRERIARDFSDHGITRDRLHFRGASSHEALLAEYADVDIALDTFPYNGGATTCDALWMGVPVVTLAGTTMIARQGASLLSAAGCAGWVASDADGYVKIAAGLASDLAHLGAERSALRDRVARSRLCDGQFFAAALLECMRAAWRRWCAAQQGQTLHDSVRQRVA
ncbi:MAG: hypothetical protein M3Z31_19010 [Pseudomonadota bacterium]|nr:hypothetical protein [Pseudomonadota bacterium]